MGKKVVHKNMMHYVLNSLGINKEETFEYDFKAKLEKLLLDNQINGFIYRNIIVQGDAENPITIYGKLIDNQIQITFTSDNFKVNSTPEELTHLSFLKNATHFLVVQYENENWQLFDRKIDAQFVTQTSIGERKTTNNQENRQIYKEFQDVDFKLYPNQEKANDRANNDLTNLANQIALQLQNPFYQTVKMRVNIRKVNSSSNVIFPPNKELGSIIENTSNVNPDYETYSITNSENLDDYEVAINIAIDKGGNIKIKHDLADDYLQEYVNKWQEEANKRGLDISVEELRQQVLTDFTNIETEKDFYKTFIQNVRATFDKQIAGYIEAVQATQKITKNIWSEGVIGKSVWYSKHEKYEEWPTYVRQPALVGGVEDGIIDEIVGIPMAIRAVYDIATDKEQREALLGMFSKEGFNAMIDALGKQAKETANDKELGQHFAGQTTIAVGSMMIPGGQASKLGKVGDVLKVTTNGLKEITNPKVLKLLETLRKAEKYKPDITKAIEQFLKKLDPKVLNKLADASGFDKAIKEMSQQWSKFHGGKFVLEYASKKIKEGKILKFEVETLDKLRRYDIQFDEVINGVKKIKNLELKNWAGWWDKSLKSQFTKDLGKMKELGDTKWIFNKKGVNQTMENLRENVVKSMKKADGTPIDELEDLFTDPKTLENIQNTFEDVSDANELLEILDDPEVFDAIFEIVEITD